MSANIDLITSHKGTPHVTVDNVRDLLAGLSGDISGIKTFALDGGLEPTISGLLEVTVATGQGLAGGWFFALEDAYTWNLDPGNAGYSRIDKLFVVIYEDSVTSEQSADLVYVAGTEYANGTHGTEPSAPTGTNIKDAYALFRVDLTDGAIVSLLKYASEYLSNSALKADILGTVSQVEENKEALNGFRFAIDQNGKYGYKKVGADTVTPFRAPQGNVQASDVLLGKTFANAENDELTGEMANNGAYTATGKPTGNNSVNVAIPEGYHDGNGYIKADGTSSYSAGKNQGHADKKSFTMRITASNWRGIYEIGVYCDGVLVWSPSQIGETADVSATLYASFNGKVTSS